MSLQKMIYTAALNGPLSDSATVVINQNGPQEPLIGESIIQAANMAGTPGFLMPAPSHTWYFYFLVMLIAGYAIARTYLGHLLSSTFTATIRFNSAASMFNDNSQLQRQRDNALYGFYFLSMGFYFMLITEKLNLTPYGLTDVRLFAFFSALIIVLYVARILAVNIIGYIFYHQNLFREYLYVGYTYNKLMGILFLPLNFMLVFTSGILYEIMIYISLVVLGFLIVMKFIRGMVFSRKRRVLSFYLFLYLCALEIVPILLLYKWFTIIV
ncbi:MAG: DUF4271 domain-containing protein [Bacteroidales bacterium]